MQNWVQPFGPALHNIFSFSCGPMEKIIAHPCSRGCYGQEGIGNNWNKFCVNSTYQCGEIKSFNVKSAI